MGEGKQNTAPVSHEDTVNSQGLMCLLWSRRWIIATITPGATIIAKVFALLIPDTYRAEALVAPDDPDRAGGLSALASQYGGLASLAGIDLTEQSVDRTALALEILKSRKFLTGFLDDHETFVGLMAVDGGNPDTDVPKIDPDIFEVAAGASVREVSLPRTTIASPQEAYEQFIGLLSVNQDKVTGFISTAIEYYSPETAKQ